MQHNDLLDTLLFILELLEGQAGHGPYADYTMEDAYAQIQWHKQNLMQLSTEDNTA